MTPSTTATKRWLTCLVVLGATPLSGCASTMPPYAASAENVSALRATDIKPLRVGSFTVDSSNRDAQSVSIRGTSLAPAQGSFADHLAQAARADLSAAGKLDDKSTRVLSGVLIRSAVDGSGVSVGTSEPVARFALDVDGKRVYAKEHRVEAKWDSSFIGAIAIPAAINNFTAGFQQLLRRLFSDTEFQAQAR